MEITQNSTFPPIACSACFADHGLRLDAEQIGLEEASACPNCGTTNSRKLTKEALIALAYRFFVWGSLHRGDYGAAPQIQFNEHQKTSIDVSPRLVSDIKVFERLLGIGFFPYGPRLWMIGEVEPLKKLQNRRTRKDVVDQILYDFPTRNIEPDYHFYRIRNKPSNPAEPLQYDSPPNSTVGKGRFDSPNFPVLYASPDLQICVHECRVTAEDELYVATLTPNDSLCLLDLSILLKDEQGSEFESLDMAVHMLFLAGKHSYEITRAIATAVCIAGFDGIIYPSYFSLLQLGVMPFETTYGISHRQIPHYHEYEQAKSIPNLAIFGRPIEQGLLSVQCINRLIMNRVEYNFHFGPSQVSTDGEWTKL